MYTFEEAIKQGLCRKGLNSEVFRRLYDSNQKKLAKYCDFRVKIKEDAEDIFQQTWLSVLDSMCKTTINNFPSWLISLARNRIYNLYRDKKNFIDSDKLESIIIANKLLSSRDTEKLFYRNLRDNKLNEALETLPENWRHVLVSKAIYGVPYSEIANQLNTTVGSVKAMRMRAMIKISKYLESIKNDLIDR